MDLGGSIRRRRKSPARSKRGGAKKSRPSKKPRRSKKSRRPNKPRARGKRSRARRARPAGRARNAFRRLLTALVVAGAGLGLGYLVAVFLMFPLPDTPIELQGVPDVRGEPLHTALAALADSGLAAGPVDSVRHPFVAAGMVIGQSPLPGLTAVARAPVRITISSGREMRPVPDLTRLAGDQAAELLAAGGFAVQVDTAESTTPAGRVLGIEPEPGTEVGLPATVRLVISKGPPTFPMPDLVGMTQGEAFAILRSRGLALGEVDRRYSLLNVRAVFGQYPEPNEPVVAGTPVRVVVGREVMTPR